MNNCLETREEPTGADDNILKCVNTLADYLILKCVNTLADYLILECVNICYRAGKTTHASILREYLNTKNIQRCWTYWKCSLPTTIPNTKCGKCMTGMLGIIYAVKKRIHVNNIPIDSDDADMLCWAIFEKTHCEDHFHLMLIEENPDEITRVLTTQDLYKEAKHFEMVFGISSGISS